MHSSDLYHIHIICWLLSGIGKGNWENWVQTVRVKDLHGTPQPNFAHVVPLVRIGGPLISFFRIITYYCQGATTAGGGIGFVILQCNSLWFSCSIANPQTCIVSVILCSMQQRWRKNRTNLNTRNFWEVLYSMVGLLRWAQTFSCFLCLVWGISPSLKVHFLGQLNGEGLG